MGNVLWGAGRAALEGSSGGPESDEVGMGVLSADTPGFAVAWEVLAVAAMGTVAGFDWAGLWWWCGGEAICMTLVDVTE